MKKVLTFLGCVLAILMAGSADLRLLATAPCAAAASCCCSDPATVDPCVCGDHRDSDFPEIAVFAGLPNLATPPAGELQIGDFAPLANLLPRWHPALPWHAPPEEMRAHLSVWVM